MRSQKTSSPKLGSWAERRALHYLTSNGLQRLECNYRCRTGEIDLIMRDRDYLVFVEVRYRKNSRFGLAVETVNSVKQAKLIATAKHYLQKQRQWGSPCRFDVLTITGHRDPAIEWYRDAFQAI
jgi:putative endonuclease